MSSAIGTRTSLRTPVASRKKRDNEEIGGVESGSWSAKRVKRIEGFAYLAKAAEDLEGICRQFSRLAERRWTAAHDMNWSEVDSTESVHRALNEQIEAHFLSSPIVNEEPDYHHSSSLNPLNITTSVARFAVHMGPPTASFDVSLEQITLRRGERVVSHPSEEEGTSYPDLLSDLLQTWRTDKMDLSIPFSSPDLVFYPPDDEEESAWKTIDMQELISLHDEVLESGHDRGRWRVDVARPKMAVGVQDPTTCPVPSKTAGVLGSPREHEGTGRVGLRGGGTDDGRAEHVERKEQWGHDTAEALVGLHGLEEDDMAIMAWILGMETIDRFTFD